MKVFIPIDDDLDQCLAADRLVPYRPGLRLWSQVTIEPPHRDDVNRCATPAHHRDSRPARPPCPH